VALGVLLVGVDDTDSRAGGCTTVFAHLLAEELGPLAAPPRLVRLNPNVPWKTRGNGALALAFEARLPLADALARTKRIVETHAQRAEGTSPGVVVSEAPLDPTLYRAAVTRIVERREADAAIGEAGALAWGGRGVVGAAAALAWPALDATWERIAHREPARIGTPRAIDPTAVRQVEESFPGLFDSYDLVEDDVVCVPASPCPVLWGLRGDDPGAAEEAARLMGPERPARETLFLTNQGTDDHLVDDAAPQAYASLRARARVAAAPIERNGHIWVELEGGLRAAAYAPTRSFRALVRQLAPEDDITACGGIHEGPDGRLTMGLEKLRVHATAPRKLGNPPCPSCGRSMKSAGRGAGWRCRACHTRADRPRTTDAAIGLGWHEVPASARRHLALPLKRMRG
jgi:tRNA(Ile2)-agmatinylcytidine synthase